jgi:hypothetical protein
MRYITIFAGLATTLPGLAFGQGTISQNFECPEDEIAATQCSGPKDCLYSNPEDCSTYIKCEVNADGRTATAFIKECPAGLKWNDSIRECDLPVRNLRSGGFSEI